jgi:4-diphosphocytidyl-2-C-methyl-D-erythritol kinase
MPALPAGRPVDVAALLAAAGNDCEPVVRVRHPAVDDLIEWLGQRVERADWARMTGTGSAAFGVFRGEESARRAMRELPEGWDGWIVRGIAESPLRRSGPRGPARGLAAGECG